MNKKNLGDFYEELACDYLLNKGYRIVCRNFRSRFGEVDIIAYKDGVCVFFEVKYRKNAAFGMPEDFVTKSKQEKIARTAMFYLMKNDVLNDYRFDIISILGEELAHIENAFFPRKALSNF